MIIYCTTRNPQSKTKELFTDGNLPTNSPISQSLLNELIAIEEKDLKPYIFEVDITDESTYKVLNHSEIQLNPTLYFEFLYELYKKGKIKKDDFYNYFDIEAFHLLLLPTVNINAKTDTIIFQDSLDGASVGKLVTSIEDAQKCISANDPFIIAIETLTPESLKVIEVSKGFITTKVGSTSHAAVIARGRGIPALFINNKLHIDSKGISDENITIKSSEIITIDGKSKSIYKGKQEISEIDSKLKSQIKEFFVEDISKKVFINTESTQELKNAKEIGVKNIGLLRLEHLIIQNEILDTFRLLYLSSILNNPLIDKFKKQFAEELSLLLTGLYKELEDGIITIRLLDPPIHEFFSIEDSKLEQLSKSLEVNKSILSDILKNMHESNPMMGNRGARLLLESEVLLFTQLDVIKEFINKTDTHVYIEVPFILNAKEGDIILDKVISYYATQDIKRDKYKVGIMFEIPSMLYEVEKLTSKVDFISFGTNDLTQFTLGLSRDDSHKVIEDYKKKGIFSKSPFEQIEIETVGQIVLEAVQKIRKIKPDIELMVCGEHGGNYESIMFFKSIGINIVSCSLGRIYEASFAMSK